MNRPQTFTAMTTIFLKRYN